ncbi:MAG: polyprenol monophosphomannose synthase [Candidatus Omnitrophota bacterium]
MQALVIIPTYNERENIEELINRLLNLNSDINVLVVDDNSPDGTGRLLDNIIKNQPRLSVIHRFDRRGRGLAGVTGFKHAIRHKADYVIEMDADFSHDPAYIPLLLEEIKDCDVVVGSRMVKGGRIVGRGFLRNALSKLSQYFIRLILGLDVLDSTSGFRCFRRRCLESIDWNKIISEGPSIIEEVAYYIKRKGFRFKEVPIVFKNRRRGRSKLNLSGALGVFFTLVRVKLFPYE